MTIPNMRQLNLGARDDVSQETQPDHMQQLVALMGKLNDALAKLRPQPCKGAPVRVFSNQTTNVLSDTSVDVRGYNAVHVQVIVSGATPSSVLSLEGVVGAGGLSILLPNTTQSAITSATSFNAVVGSEFIKVRMASTSGTFGSGQGFTVIVTPYNS